MRIELNAPMHSLHYTLNFYPSKMNISSTGENCKVDLYGKIIYDVISHTYIKETEKLILCVNCDIIHLENVARIREKRAKYTAKPCVLHAFLIFSQHFPQASSYNRCTRLVIYWLIELFYAPNDTSHSILFYEYTQRLYLNFRNETRG